MENGELRFRLRHIGGTGYIRTQSTASSGWQKSHVHKSAIETYVVQSGWMALAELIDSQMTVRVFEANDIVTTKPGVTHNVYLSGNSTIHTVKYGDVTGMDREAGRLGPVLDIATTALDSEAKILAAAITTSTNATYSEEYRHFDNLIWQVPVWSTGIFALSIQSIFQIISQSKVPDEVWRWLPVLMFF